MERIGFGCWAPSKARIGLRVGVGVGSALSTKPLSGLGLPLGLPLGLRPVAQRRARISAKAGGIASREDDYSQWYLDVISSAQLADSSPVKGCLVIRPHGFAIWETIRDELDRLIKKSGAVNAYFPLLIPQSFLSKEAEHVEGFAKECALVTHHRLRVAPDGSGLEPDPAAKLDEPLVIRPTSETMIWHMFGKWIQSYRDLPLMVNQWCNVLRWELRTRPFLRTAEFLWQEGHTAHATKDDAVGKSKEMIAVYASVFENMLAIPVITGAKSPTERFAGAEDTYTIEALMQNGWALQCGTSHFLGQNFARAFDVLYQNEDGDRELVWATSWGVSTRIMGALIMSHSDDTGLVLPPKVAPVQVAIVTMWKNEEQELLVRQVAEKAKTALQAQGVRVTVDDRTDVRLGAKCFEWERKGVPLRMEIGPRDAAKGSAFCAKRNGGSKFSMPIDENFVSSTETCLGAIHDELHSAATDRLSSRTYEVSSYADMKQKLSADAGFFLVPWKCDAANEEKIKEDCKATIRCYPFDDQVKAQGKSCFYSGEPADRMALFARAY